MQRKDAPNITVIGAGVVGGSVVRYFREQGIAVGVYDPPKGKDDIGAIDQADIVFVCVPTPNTPGRGFDDRHLHDALRLIDGCKAVVIKSTVLPGTTELLQDRYPQHRFMFNPEFLREATAYEDFVRPDRQVVGCTMESASDAETAMALLPRAPFERICSTSEAEMAKYVANSFLAVKVIYANEVYDLCERLRIPYEGVRDVVAGDVRIGGSHMDVFASGYRGYGGKCLPKDSKALLDLARTVGVDMEILSAADRVNAGLNEAEVGALVSPVHLQPVETAPAASERAA
jgi:UDPglucose 6-dehydrogenase